MINLDDVLSNDDILWQMTPAEKMAIYYVLNKMEKRDIAIEIGSYKGGFLRVLSKYFKKVYSCDITFDGIENREQYKNVRWVQGDSKDTLPKLISDLNKLKTGDVNFILVDGDHEHDTVLRDINNILKYVPRTETIVLMHDSWYEPTREAINQADWYDNKHVHLVEKDLVHGDTIWNSTGYLTVSGLAIAILYPNERDFELQIGQTYDFMYTLMRRLIEDQNTPYI